MLKESHKKKNSLIIENGKYVYTNGLTRNNSLLEFLFIGSLANERKALLKL
jgi:hypothetical protein